MKVRLKKPRESFMDYWRRTSREQYLRDMQKLSGMLYLAAKKKSTLDVDVKVELVVKLAKKIQQRHRLQKKHPLARWDGRHWRGVEPIRKRLEAAYSQEES